jgi:large subunit ribosomal protein L21
MTYAIIALGGKQYRVQEGERLLVDRLPYAEAKSFHPDVLFLGGDGSADIAPKGAQVTAKVVRHVLGDKILIGKYKPKKGYRRHIGHRSRLSQVQIETIRKKAPARQTAAKGEAAEKKPAARKPAAEKKPAARKPPARRPAAKKEE